MGSPRAASVIVPSHDRPDAVRALLGDLVGQAGITSAELEVIVVDSAGVDATERVCRDFEHADIPVRRISGPSTLAAKRNVGANEARGKILIFLDDDMRVGSDFVRTHVSAQETSAAVLSSTIRFPQDWVGESNYYRYKDLRHRNADLSELGRVPLRGNRFVAMAFSIPAQMYTDVGGFDERFRKYGGEDIEFGFRVVRRGISSELLPKAVAIHREIGMDIRVFAMKVYRATYYGTPMVLERAPEARNVPIFRLTEATIDAGRRMGMVRMGLRLLNLLRVRDVLMAILLATDRRKSVFVPAFYDATILLTTQLAVDDREMGRADRSSSSRLDIF